MEKLAQELARREKRVLYLRNHFSTATPACQHAHSVLDTYAMLLSKLSTSPTGPELVEIEGRLSASERELNMMFNASRLLTSGTEGAEKLRVA